MNSRGSRSNFPSTQSIGVTKRCPDRWPIPPVVCDSIWKILSYTHTHTHIYIYTHTTAMHIPVWTPLADGNFIVQSLPQWKAPDICFPSDNVDVSIRRRIPQLARALSRVIGPKKKWWKCGASICWRYPRVSPYVHSQPGPVDYGSDGQRCSRLLVILQYPAVSCNFIMEVLTQHVGCIWHMVGYLSSSHYGRL